MRVITYTTETEAEILKAYSAALPGAQPGEDQQRAEVADFTSREAVGYTSYRVGTAVKLAPVSYVDETAKHRLKFNSLASDWRLERSAMSSITEMTVCPAYLGIIGMGQDAVPLLIEQIRTEGDDPDQWFVALRIITGADPVDDENRGDSVKMAQAWLEWAERSGYDS